jgi:hypothetical protein
MKPISPAGFEEGEKIKILYSTFRWSRRLFPAEPTVSLVCRENHGGSPFTF